MFYENLVSHFRIVNFYTVHLAMMNTHTKMIFFCFNKMKWNDNSRSFQVHIDRVFSFCFSGTFYLFLLSFVIALSLTSEQKSEPRVQWTQNFFYMYLFYFAFPCLAPALARSPADGALWRNDKILSEYFLNIFEGITNDLWMPRRRREKKQSTTTIKFNFIANVWNVFSILLLFEIQVDWSTTTTPTAARQVDETWQFQRVSVSMSIFGKNNLICDKKSTKTKL